MKRLMKIPLAATLLSTFTVMWFDVSFAAHTYAREVTLSLDLRNKKVVDVLDAIEKQSEFRFFYNDRLVNVDRVVSVKASNKNVFAILDEMFADHGVDYKVVDRDVILTASANPDAAARNTPQQQRVVRGTVTDPGGVPIVGAGVGVKGTSDGAITDASGSYAIGVADGNATLVFNYFGYNTVERTVGTSGVIDVTMQESIREMDEVVVIGYGTVKRANLGGAVSTADARVFQSRPIQSATSALMGEVPGLTIIRASGNPSDNPVMRIRDRSSVNGGAPLILIDGAQGDLNAINPVDIENISVLKDATAAIYGARAADGVILVTTRNAQRNQPLRVTFDASFSLKTPALLKRPTTLLQHAEMALEITDGSFPVEYAADELDKIRQGAEPEFPIAEAFGRWGTAYGKFYKYHDWTDTMIGNGTLQTYNVGLSGGGDKYTYLISLGHQRETGILNYGKDLNRRYYVRLKSTIDIARNLSYDINLAYDAGDREYSSAISRGQNVWELIWKTRTWAPMYNPDGNFFTFEGFLNPAQAVEQGGETERVSGNFNFNNQLTWKVLDGLNVIGRASIRKSDRDEYAVDKGVYMYNWANVQTGTNRFPNAAERNYQKTLSKNFTLFAEYKKTFGRHDVGLMVGTSHESEDYDRFWAKRVNFDQQEHMPLPLGSAENQSASGTGSAWTINSVFARLNYTFAGKYILEGTLRNDGTSRFASDARWGYFPGVSAAWRVGDERWINSLGVFDDLKFRASWGETGQQSGIGNYDYIPLIGISGDYYPFGSNTKGQMANQSNMVDLSRTWETVATTNAGVDFSVLDDRLHGSFDYFWKTNRNMLIPVTYPSVLGTSAPRTNSGKMKIWGWEAVLGWRDRIGEFNYSVTASLSDVQNEIASRIGTSLIGKGRNETPVGYPMEAYFGYQFDGIIQNEQELAEYKALFPNNGTIQGARVGVGDAKYKDLNGDGNLTAFTGEDGDLVYLGTTDPRYTFGVNIRMEWKGFDLSMFLQGVGKRIVFLEGDSAGAPFAQAWFQSARYWYGKTWTADRTNAKYPAISANGTRRGYNYDTSTNTIHNMAYVRMKNLQLGYTIPQRITQKAKLDRVRVYFSGEDLFEFHNAPDGWDPEEGGGSIGGYPFARNYSLGVNFTF